MTAFEHAQRAAGNHRHLFARRTIAWLALIIVFGPLIGVRGADNSRLDDNGGRPGNVQFDRSALASPATLPPETDVRYKQANFWDLYRWHVIGTITFCIVQALLIVALLVQRSSRMRAVERFQRMFEAAPIGMVMISHEGNIVLANRQLQKLFGHSAKELLGLSIMDLIPHFSSRLPFRRLGDSRSKHSLGFAADRELHGRRKDGTEFPLQIGLSPVQTEAGNLVLVSIVDSTERKIAEQELHDGQRELRELTGKLLHAQEDERHRIARELHDDLSQTLALLAMELDLTARNPPDGALKFRGRMQELTARVKQVSSSVHDLSHQLHPLKLEQLGVVPAIRSLCKELKQSYHLQIDFAVQQVPRDIPAHVGLCLYRIVQEALRNVIKYAKVDRAELELSGKGDEICLRIVDHGIGFDPALVSPGAGLGLVSIRERLRLVGGMIGIDSRPGAGTRIEIRVPLTPTGAPDLVAQSPPQQSDSTVTALV
jgi:PAS domain S-box-containing protein